MLMTDGGRNGRGQSLLLEVPARRGSADAPAAPCCRVSGNLTCFVRRTAREQNQHLPRHPGNQFAILLATQGGCSCPCGRPRICIERALPLGSLQGRVFYKNSLPLVASARLAETDHNRRAPAVFRGATRQSGVAGREILEVAQARAGQAQWLLRFHEEEAVRREFGAT